jgi:hypothetical protein
MSSADDKKGSDEGPKDASEGKHDSVEGGNKARAEEDGRKLEEGETEGGDDKKASQTAGNDKKDGDAKPKDSRRSRSRDRNDSKDERRDEGRRDDRGDPRDLRRDLSGRPYPRANGADEPRRDDRMRGPPPPMRDGPRGGEPPREWRGRMDERMGGRDLGPPGRDFRGGGGRPMDPPGRLGPPLGAPPQRCSPMSYVLLRVGRICRPEFANLSTRECSFPLFCVLNQQLSSSGFSSHSLDIEGMHAAYNHILLLSTSPFV